MKNRNRFLIATLIVTGVLIILTSSCKKNNVDPTANTISDIDGNVYHTVTLGTQVWMVENLKTTKYGNGDLIGTTSPSTLKISGENAPKYQWAYAGNESNIATYGRLYTWYAVTDSRNICPAGWHVPDNDDWTTLADYLADKGYGYQGSGGDIGKSLAATTGWDSSTFEGVIGNDQSSNNITGFTALPGGLRYSDGVFCNLGLTGCWWTSIDFSNGYAFECSLGYNDMYIYRCNDSKTVGNSVRCVKDE